MEQMKQIAQIGHVQMVIKNVLITYNVFLKEEIVI